MKEISKTNIEAKALNQLKIISIEIDENYEDTGDAALIVEISKNGKKQTFLEWLTNEDGEYSLFEFDSHLHVNQAAEVKEFFALKNVDYDDDGQEFAIDFLNSILTMMQN